MIVIRAEKLGKQYRVGEREPYLALRDVLARSLRAPARLFGRGAVSSNHDATHIWALKDVSFEVRQGEVVGIIGRNGAGKTTLLKILARVTKPTHGFADIRGRMGSLLEVGTGFHSELTGRENVFLSGAILGMSKREIQRKFDEIVAFAEFEEFIDTPLKHYSTGMQMRLAFAVAAHLEPEILLVDEVLAVGDVAFQKKCLGKMSDIAKGGRTILFVSHQMNQIRRLCQRSLWVDAGQIKGDGPTPDVLGAYESAVLGRASQRRSGESADTGARFLGWELVRPRINGPYCLKTLGPLSLRFVLEASREIKRGVHGVTLYSSEGQMMWGTAAYNLALSAGLHEFVYNLSMLPVRPGAYHWMVSLWEDGRQLDLWNCVPPLVVSTTPLAHPCDEWAGLLNVPYSFAVGTTSRPHFEECCELQGQSSSLINVGPFNRQLSTE